MLFHSDNFDYSHAKIYSAGFFQAIKGVFLPTFSHVQCAKIQGTSRSRQLQTILICLRCQDTFAQVSRNEFDSPKRQLFMFLFVHNCPLCGTKTFCKIINSFSFIKYCPVRSSDRHQPTAQGGSPTHACALRTPVPVGVGAQHPRTRTATRARICSGSSSL